MNLHYRPRLGDLAGVLALSLVIGGAGSVAVAAGGRPTHETMTVSNTWEGVSQDEFDYATRFVAYCPLGYSATGGGYMVDIDDRERFIQFNGFIRDEATGREGWMVRMVWPLLEDGSRAGPVDGSAHVMCLKTRH